MKLKTQATIMMVLSIILLITSVFGWFFVGIYIPSQMDIDIEVPNIKIKHFEVEDNETRLVINDLEVSRCEGVK